MKHLLSRTQSDDLKRMIDRMTAYSQMDQEEDLLYYKDVVHQIEAVLRRHADNPRLMRSSEAITEIVEILGE